MMREKSLFHFGLMPMLVLTIHTQQIVHLKPAPPILMHILNLLLSMENLTMIVLSALKKLQVLITQIIAYRYETFRFSFTFFHPLL